MPPYEPNPFPPNLCKKNGEKIRLLGLNFNFLNMVHILVPQSMGNSISCPYWHSKLKKQFCRLDHYVSKEPFLVSLRHICMLRLAPFSLLFRIEFHARLTIDLATAPEFFYFFEETTHGGKIEDGVGPPTPPEMSSMKNPEREEPADRLARFLCCSIHCKTLLVALKKRKGTI